MPSWLAQLSFPLPLLCLIGIQQAARYPVCPQELFPDVHQNLSKLLEMSEEAVAACALNFTVCLCVHVL